MVKEENLNKPATRKQLWALYVATKKDYRNSGLTMGDASALLDKFNKDKVIPKVGVCAADKKTKEPKLSKEKKLENEFLEFMNEKMQGIINTAKDALKVKSVLEDDPSIVKDPSKRKQYAFVGFGCGFSILRFDKRSKVGKQIYELSSKHHMTTFLKKFMGAFTKKEIDYYQSIGCPLSAIFAQDIRINDHYTHCVMQFMEKKGVKNVRYQTYYD